MVCFLLYTMSHPLTIGLAIMRTLIVSCLASAGILLAGVASANIGDSVSRGPLGTGTMDKLGGHATQVHVPSVQTMFQGPTASASFQGGAAHQGAASTSVDAWGLPHSEHASSEAMLLAGGILVVALVIRRISG